MCTSVFLLLFGGGGGNSLHNREGKWSVVLLWDLRVSEQWEDQCRTGKETAVWFCATQNRGKLSLKSPMWLYNLKTQQPLCHGSGSVTYSLYREGEILDLTTLHFLVSKSPLRCLSFILSPTVSAGLFSLVMSPLVPTQVLFCPFSHIIYWIEQMFP